MSVRRLMAEDEGAALRDDVEADAGSACRAAEWPSRIDVRLVGLIEEIRVDDILHIQSAGDYVELRMAGHMILHRITLNRPKALLAPEDVLRVHRSAIVRRGKIARLKRPANAVSAC